MEDNSENMGFCRDNCAKCPSFQKSAPVLYCIRGKAEKPSEMKGCKCGMCGVFIGNKLDGAYFCNHGAASK